MNPFWINGYELTKKLNLLPDEDFLLLGIVSQEKDYRLCFGINKKLETALKKEKDLEIMGGKLKDPSAFSVYQYDDPEGRCWNLIGNKGTGGWLVPEQKQMDYFLMLKGNFSKDDLGEIMLQVRQVTSVQGAYEVDVKKLKSKQNLVF